MIGISIRQQEIIGAAGRILTSSGISGLTTKNLAKEMQFSEGAIYRHFTSKEEVILAMLEYLAEDMDSRCFNTISKVHSAEEKYIALFESQFSFFKNNPHFVVAVFSDGLMEVSERVNKAILKIMSVKMKYLRSIINQGQKENVFNKDIKTDDLVDIVVGTFRLQMSKWRMGSFKYDIKKEGSKIINSVLDLIKN